MSPKHYLWALSCSAVFGGPSLEHCSKFPARLASALIALQLPRGHRRRKKQQSGGIHLPQVKSFGVGQHVKLPGPSQDKPNTYAFGTTYEYMFNDLKAKDPDLYERNGLLNMLQRNMAVKRAPDRWQENRKDVFDVIITYADRVMEKLIEDMKSRTQKLLKPCLVLNMDTTDNHVQAAIAGNHTLTLCQLLEATKDWEDDIDNVVLQFEASTGWRPVYSVCWY